jgi:EmrB/QacA subfamily drug resistance transporter/prevent-host-death family protein
MFGENSRTKVIVLLTMCFALFMAMLDNTVVNVALPTLSRELNAGVSGLQWIVDGYVLAFASLLLTGGILGDRYGRKRMFLTGLAVFTLASLASALSTTTGQLIAFRALQGVGGALLMPGTLSILTVTFPAEERAKAIGIWAGVSGIALALGPTAGGWLVEHAGWQSVFLLNVPIGLTGFAVAARTVRESREEEARALDLPGLALGTGALFSATYGLIEANQRGWADPVILASLAAAVALLGAFLMWEHSSASAMMPLRFFRVPAFSAGNAVAFAISLGMFGTFFFFSLYMQIVRGYSAFDAGLRFLPMTAMIVLTAPNAGRVAQRHGSRLPMTVGLTLAATGLLLMSRVGAGTSYALMLPLLVMMGVGMGSTMAPMTAAVMNSVGPMRAGLGSAMTNTSREVGGVLGIALLGTLLTTSLKSTLPVKLSALGLVGTQQSSIIASAGHGRLDPALLGSLAPSQATAVRAAFGASFVGGFHIAVLVAAAVLFAAAVIARLWIPGADRKREASLDAVRRPDVTMAVGLSEFRTRPAEIFRRAETGASFLVTSRGRPVAYVIPADSEVAPVPMLGSAGRREPSRVSA